VSQAGALTGEHILDAARVSLLEAGYAQLSTRKIADRAAVPLSQIHYHFGGKSQLILRLLERENERLLDRQRHMYGQERPLSERYDQACDFFDEDLASGYVRVLQEMIAVSWSEPEIAAAVRQVLRGWFDLLTSVIEAAEQALGSIGPFTAKELSALVGTLFMGAETMTLVGIEEDGVPVRSALRRIGTLIRELEENHARS
jgi:AcrR family transcriptional regulator